MPSQWFGNKEYNETTADEIMSMCVKNQPTTELTIYLRVLKNGVWEPANLKNGMAVTSDNELHSLKYFDKICIRHTEFKKA